MPISMRLIFTMVRFDNFDQVVAHFDKTFDLGLSAQDKQDLVAYLTAVGNGVMPYQRG